MIEKKYSFKNWIKVLIIAVIIVLGLLTHGNVPIPKKNTEDSGVSKQIERPLFLSSFDKDSLQKVGSKEVIAVGILGNGGQLLDSNSNSLILETSDSYLPSGAIALFHGTTTLSGIFDVEKIIVIKSIPSESETRGIVNSALNNPCKICKGNDELLNCVKKYSMKSRIELDWINTLDEATLKLNYVTYLNLSGKQEIVLTRDLLSDKGDFSFNIDNINANVCLSRLDSVPERLYPTNNPKDEKIDIVYINHDERDTSYLNINHLE